MQCSLMIDRHFHCMPLYRTITSFPIYFTMMAVAETLSYSPLTTRATRVHCIKATRFGRQHSAVVPRTQPTHPIQGTTTTDIMSLLYNLDYYWNSPLKRWMGRWNLLSFYWPVCWACRRNRGYPSIIHWHLSMPVSLLVRYVQQSKFPLYWTWRIVSEYHSFQWYPSWWAVAEFDESAASFGRPVNGFDCSHHRLQLKQQQRHFINQLDLNK